MTKRITALVLWAIIFAGLGVWASPFIMQQMGLKTCPEPVIDQNNTYEAGWEAARQRLIDNEYMPTEQTNEPLNSINGLITSVGTGQIVINIHSQDLLIKPNLKTRTIQVDDNTTVNIQHIKDGTATEASFEDLKMAQSIEVVSDQEIKNQADITPTEINIFDFDGIDILTGET